MEPSLCALRYDGLVIKPDAVFRHKFFNCHLLRHENRLSNLLRISPIDELSRLFSKLKNVAHGILILLQRSLVVLQDDSIRHGDYPNLAAIIYPDRLRSYTLENGNEVFIASLSAARIAGAALGKLGRFWRLFVANVVGRIGGARLFHFRFL